MLDIRTHDTSRSLRAQTHGVFALVDKLIHFFADYIATFAHASLEKCA